MESTFRIIFWTGLAGCVGWFWYAVFGTHTPLGEAVGVSAGTLLLIGVAGLLFFWIPQAFDLGKANTAAQHTVAGTNAAKRAVLARTKLWHWLAAFGIAAVALTGWYMNESAEQAKAYKANLTVQVRSRCTSWINDEFNDGSTFNPAKAYDSWEKNGHIVVEVGWKETRSSKSLKSRLCVYNPSTGRIQSPGAFGRGRWEKY